MPRRHIIKVRLIKGESRLFDGAENNTLTFPSIRAASRALDIDYHRLHYHVTNESVTTQNGLKIRITKH